MAEPTVTDAIRSTTRPPFLVAELSGNHGGDLAWAKALIDAAADAGADAVKLQTYRPDTITLEVREPPFLIEGGLWDGRYLADLYAEAMTPWEWHAELADQARGLGLVLFSSPFDETAVDFLEETIDPPLYKIASFELNHLPLLRRVAQTGKPVAASSGVSGREEIETAIECLRANGCPLVVILQCVSDYPADPKEFHLSAIPLMAEEFGVVVGLSDHSPGHVVAVAATALGARLIEKHLVLDREDGSIDAAFSMEPDEFRAMAEAVRTAHAALGSPLIGAGGEDLGHRRFRRSIFVSAPIRKGEPLTPENLRIVRPADGLSPTRWDEVLGRTAARDMPEGHPLGETDWVP